MFHYLNFFSLMYSRKPLTSASGPKAEADMKDILLQGRRIDADKALRTVGSLNGVPSLVPRDWVLVRRAMSGNEEILATNVADFDVSADGTIYFSNGGGVFRLASNQAAEVVVAGHWVSRVSVGR